MLTRDKFMISCVKQIGILIIKIVAVELPHNNNTRIKVETKDHHLSLHLHQMGITIKVRKPRKTSINTIQVMSRVKSVQRTFSKIIGKISGMVQA